LRLPLLALDFDPLAEGWFNGTPFS
jgi:hypothetical protein